MENTSQKIGIIYCRVSSLDQVEGTSLESQERMCKEYADKQNIKILKIFVEKGESAKTVHRTEFNKALAVCADKKNPVNYFIVYKLDRFSRNQDDHVTVRALLRRSGTELRSATEAFDGTPFGRAMEGILSVFAELDNNVRTERTKGGMLERIKKGFWCWKNPSGYYRPTQGANITPDAIKAPLIRLAFEEYAKGIYTYQALADFIGDRGLVTEFGNKPSAQSMEKILRNPIYCGVIDIWGEKHQGAFEPIVSKELFQKCHPYEGPHASPRSANNPLFPLRKLVVCSFCETPMTGSTPTGRKGKKYTYYHHGHQHCQNSTSIPKATFEQLFVEYLESITPDEEREKLFKATLINIWKDNYKQLDEQNAKIRKEITILEHERQQVFEFHRTGKYTDKEFEEQKRLVNERIEQKGLLTQQKLAEGWNMEEALDHCFNFVRNTAQAWLRSDYGDKLQLQRQIFKESVKFDGKSFGTANLSPIFQTKRTSRDEKSLLVALRGVEPRLTD